MLAQLASGATATEHALMGHVTGAGQLGLHAGTIHGAWAAECLSTSGATCCSIHMHQCCLLAGAGAYPL
eukprot:scaffold38604_cov33-Phaeocystis_antarctica.AAC.2